MREILQLIGNILVLFCIKNIIDLLQALFTKKDYLRPFKLIFNAVIYFSIFYLMIDFFEVYILTAFEVYLKYMGG